MSYLKRFKDRVEGDSVGFVGKYPQTPTKSQYDTLVQYNDDRLIDSQHALKNDIRTCTREHHEKFASVRGQEPTETTKPRSVGFVGNESRSRRWQQEPEHGRQVGPFNPADLDDDGTFNVDKYFARIRAKHGVNAAWERLREHTQ